MEFLTGTGHTAEKCTQHKNESAKAKNLKWFQKTTTVNSVLTLE